MIDNLAAAAARTRPVGKRGRRPLDPTHGPMSVAERQRKHRGWDDFRDNSPDIPLKIQRDKPSQRTLWRGWARASRERKRSEQRSAVLRATDTEARRLIASGDESLASWRKLLDKELGTLVFAELSFDAMQETAEKTGKPTEIDRDIYRRWQANHSVEYDD